MRLIFSVFALIASLVHLSAMAVEFTGEWTADICYDGKGKPCGGTAFSLIQNGNRICGDHTFYTANAGRMNEGKPGSVRGTVVGNTAILVVTSGRNGAVVLGKASLVGKNLRWETLEEISAGDPQADALIFGKGTLKNSGNEVGNELRSACQ